MQMVIGLVMRMERQMDLLKQMVTGLDLQTVMLTAKLMLKETG